MKKFYSGVLLAVVMLCGSLYSHAQIVGGVYSTVQDGPVSDPATWGGVGSSPDFTQTCTDCTFNLNFDNTVDVLINNVLGASVVNIATTVHVNNYVQLQGTTVVYVAANATLFVNDEIDLYDGSYVRLNDVGATVNALNVDGNPTCHGPIGTDPSNSGIYYDDLPKSAGFNQAHYWDVLGQFGYGYHNAPPGFYANQYNLNCAPPAFNCAPGVVYGPAISETSPDPTNGDYQFVAATPLPVVLVKFTAQAQGTQSVLVSWTTAQETNSNYFAVERSADGANWVSLGNVTAKGFSNVATDYSFTDKAPLSGTSYYKLKVVDRDATFKYSKVIPVNIAGNSQALVIYSNPFVDQIRLKVNVGGSDNLNLILTDMQGKTYLTQSYQALPGDNFINLQPVGAAAGLYMLSIQGNTYSQTVKIMKQ